MKKSIALVLAASTFLLAGCCTTPHVTKWEYKVTGGPHTPFGESPQELRDLRQNLLNDLGKEGWVLINVEEGRIFYFKRPIK